jgi:hypothetical protein
VSEHKKTPTGGCSECGAEPSEVAAYPECSEVVRGLHKRGHTEQVFPLAEFFCLAATPVSAVAMRILSVGEEGEAQDAADKTRAEHSKRAGDGAEEARKNPNALAAEQTLEVLFRACHMVDDKGKPTPWAAFPGVRWMRRELTSDKLATLLALYDELKRKYGGTKLDIDDETVETIARVLYQHLGDDLPESFLAPYPRWFLTHLAVLIAAKLGEARKSVDLLLQERAAFQVERDAWQAERATLEAELAAARGEVPAPPAADVPDDEPTPDSSS